MLLAAQASDELLGIRGINAAFVLADTEEQIAISGRSYGQINVQVILEKLGGGGHLTMAGAQLKGATMEEAIARLEEAIDWYEQENSEK
jgi:c-di-AMP phosphodiesterase-like protein